MIFVILWAAFFAPIYYQNGVYRGQYEDKDPDHEGDFYQIKSLFASTFYVSLNNALGNFYNPTFYSWENDYFGKPIIPTDPLIIGYSAWTAQALFSNLILLNLFITAVSEIWDRVKDQSVRIQYQHHVKMNMEANQILWLLSKPLPNGSKFTDRVDQVIVLKVLEEEKEEYNLEKSIRGIVKKEVKNIQKNQSDIKSAQSEMQLVQSEMQSNIFEMQSDMSAMQVSIENEMKEMQQFQTEQMKAMFQTLKRIEDNQVKQKH